MDKRKPDVPEQMGPEIPIRTNVVPMGLPGVNHRAVDGYVLATGIVLLESERDSSGNYVGGAGMDGMYLRTPCRYASVKNEDGSVRAFREVRKAPARSRHREPER